MPRQSVFDMKLNKVYPLLIQKAERKGRTKEEVDQAILWLTGYDEAQLVAQVERGVDYRTFFEEAPAINPKMELVKGVICGIRVEEINGSNSEQDVLARMEEKLKDLHILQ